MKSPSARLRRLLSRLWRDARGATAVEYGMIVALIVIVMIVAFTQLASTTTGLWNNVSAQVSAH